MHNLQHTARTARPSMCLAPRACAILLKSVLGSRVTAQAQNPIPHGEGPKRRIEALKQFNSRSCGESFRHNVQVSGEGAAACLLPACSNPSDCPLCRSAPRRAGRRDHPHHHGHRGHERHRPLRASRRHRGRLSVNILAARNSTVVLELAGTVVPPGGRGGGPAT
eukprot:CAMPEP_0115851810 /NCGR_PEP_ID=MMETSP0287-20121206/12673_1 /TAXON_ID=412157 /ORGANISM="Chrysochromulina rotalis, Strain UIO044" /LENGTH=164 /DNA_ID=CAMNT_0003305853 /DNA_START=112 /DNA_END=603 /DNA_ORIENTATION=-